MEYRIISNGKEFKVQHKIRFLFISSWADEGRMVHESAMMPHDPGSDVFHPYVFQTQDDAQQYIRGQRAKEEQNNSAKQLNQWDVVWSESAQPYWAGTKPAASQGNGWMPDSRYTERNDF